MMQLKQKTLHRKASLKPTHNCTNYDAQIALLDITGAPVLDQEAAQALAQAVAGARLVGAECVLVGVSPDVAARLVDLGVDVSAFESRVDMEAGVRYALARLDHRLVREPARRH